MATTTRYALPREVTQRFTGLFQAVNGSDASVQQRASLGEEVLQTAHVANIHFIRAQSEPRIAPRPLWERIISWVSNAALGGIGFVGLIFIGKLATDFAGSHPYIAGSLLVIGGICIFYDNNLHLEVRDLICSRL